MHAPGLSHIIILRALDRLLIALLHVTSRLSLYFIIIIRCYLIIRLPIIWLSITLSRYLKEKTEKRPTASFLIRKLFSSLFGDKEPRIIMPPPCIVATAHETQTKMKQQNNQKMGYTRWHDDTMTNIIKKKKRTTTNRPSWFRAFHDCMMAEIPKD